MTTNYEPRIREAMSLVGRDDWKLDPPGELIVHALGMCSCGSGDDRIANLLEKVLRVAGKRGGRVGLGNFLDSIELELAAKILDAHGLLNHGTNIGWAWTTPLGDEMIEKLDQLKAINTK